MRRLVCWREQRAGAALQSQPGVKLKGGQAEEGPMRRSLKEVLMVIDVNQIKPEFANDQSY